MQINNIRQNSLYAKNNKINLNKNNQPSFKGGYKAVIDLPKPKNFYDGVTNVLAKGINKLTNNEGFAKFATKFGNKNKKAFPTIIAAESFWLGGFYALSAYKNSKVEQKQKETEVIYQFLVASFAALGAFTIDGAVNKQIKKFIDVFKKLNASMPAKQIDTAVSGIKNLKTMVIFTTVYRFLGPVLINPVANKISGHFQKKAEEKKAAEEAQKTK